VQKTAMQARRDLAEQMNNLENRQIALQNLAANQGARLDRRNADLSMFALQRAKMEQARNLQAQQIKSDVDIANQNRQQLADIHAANMAAANAQLKSTTAGFNMLGTNLGALQQQLGTQHVQLGNALGAMNTTIGTGFGNLQTQLSNQTAQQAQFNAEQQANWNQNFQNQTAAQQANAQLWQAMGTFEQNVIGGLTNNAQWGQHIAGQGQQILAQQQQLMEQIRQQLENGQNVGQLLQQYTSPCAGNYCWLNASDGEFICAGGAHYTTKADLVAAAGSGGTVPIRSPPHGVDARDKNCLTQGTPP
jgi:hypothetical protein